MRRLWPNMRRRAVFMRRRRPACRPALPMRQSRRAASVFSPAPSRSRRLGGAGGNGLQSVHRDTKPSVANTIHAGQLTCLRIAVTHFVHGNTAHIFAGLFRPACQPRGLNALRGAVAADCPSSASSPTGSSITSRRSIWNAARMLATPSRRGPAAAEPILFVPPGIRCRLFPAVLDCPPGFRARGGRTLGF